MSLHMPPSPYAAPDSQKGGASRPRPGEADRQRRSADRDSTPSRPATCGIRVPHARSRFPCTRAPMSNALLRIGSGLRRIRTPRGGSTAIAE